MKTFDVRSVVNEDNAMIPISVASEILHIHQRTLRIYDEKNILKPSRSLKNTRLYSLNDIEKGKFVLYLSRELGINIAGIQIILHLLQNQGLDNSSNLAYMKEIANDLNITLEDQEINRVKSSRKGRKRKEI